ncbi:MAG: class I SAM-dependent methyltransferase [Alphaproteobacteria bacterium]|nr:class I SAM-dependent methyltransferase [Alphaproteobacteria bacterium]
MVEWRWEHPDAQAAFAEWVGFPDQAATACEVDEIERLLGLRPADRILDIGCGTGRHAVDLAKRGYRVVGIDIAEAYLAEAARAIERTGVPVELRHQRASEISEKGHCAAALAINFTLGFMDDSELRDQFERVRQALRPGGKLLLKTAGPQCLPGAAPQASKNWGEKAGRFILSEKRMEGRIRVEHNIVIDPAAREIVEYHEEQRAFSRGEVVGLLQRSGFQTIQCLKDLSGKPGTDEHFGVYVCMP